MKVDDAAASEADLGQSDVGQLSLVFCGTGKELDEGHKMPKSKVHQIFVGCPFLAAIRKNYDKLKADLEKETPLHIVLADTTAVSSTDYLLEHITNLIRESAACVFDATGGNPNVSLEIGIAHAMPANFLLALYTRKPRTQQAAQRALQQQGETKPIISDLQGRNRIEYKTYTTLKTGLTNRYLKSLPYMKRWQEYKKRNSSLTGYAIQVFQQMRESGRTVRPRVVTILDSTGIDVSDFLQALSHAKLLTVKRGRDGGIYYPAK